MSKAFTKESDTDLEEVPASRSALPPGTRNYLTPDGSERLRAELRRLMEEERPAIMAAPEEDDVVRRLRRLDTRIRDLTERLENAEIVPPPAEKTEEVQFGATVTVRDEAGEVFDYRIVGVDEVDFDCGWVSWMSPIARGLIGASAGEGVTLETPGGPRKLTILRVSYSTE